MAAPATGQDGNTSARGCDAVLAELEKLGPSQLVDSFNGIWMVYEDRVSRQPLRRAIQIQEERSDALAGCDIAGFAPRRFGLSLPAFTSDGEMVSDKRAPSTRLSHGLQVDLELELLYNFAIDYPEDWLRDRIALAPKVKLWWPSGVLISAQYALPIRNQQPERHAQYWSKPYPNVLMAGVRRQLSPQWVGSLSAGFYDRNRYGGDFQLYWMSNRWPLVLGGRASASGYWSFSDGELERGRINFWTGYLDGTLFLPWYNIRLRGRTGQFIREINQYRRPGEDVKLNPGTSGEVTRMFGEVEIGLHGFYDGYNIYPGFRFAAPLSPRKGIKRGRVAFYPARQLYVPYDLGRVVRGKNTGYVRPDRGELHRTDLDIWPDLRLLSPVMRERFR